AVITKLKDLVYDEEYTVPAALGPKNAFVKYLLNAAGSTKASAKLLEGNIAALPSDYTTSSMEFKGWQVFEKVGDSYYYLSKFYDPSTVGKNFAKNKEYPPVLFPYWSGTSSYIKLPTATQPGYDFIGWSKVADAGKFTELYLPKKDKNGTVASYRPSTNGTENLYAQWTPKTYKVSLVVPDNVVITEGYQSSVTMTFDKTVPNITPLKIDKHAFKGYYDKLDADGKPTADAVQYYDANGNGQLVWKIYDGSVTELYAYVISEIEVNLDGRGATKQEQTSVKVRYGEPGAIDADGNAGGSVIPPEKTGYTFGGYYTGIRGTGRQYFAADGRGIAEWVEKKTDILYAYWLQNPVELPEQEETEPPSVLPEERIEIEAALEKSTVHIYADDNNPETGAETDVQPYLVSDVVIDGVLETAGGIPSTENVAIRAGMGSWMLSCVLERHSGVDEVRVLVTVPYRTQYENPEDESLIISEVLYETFEYMVPKAWSYWSLAEGGLYFPEEVVVENEALREGQEAVLVTWDGPGAVQKPSYRITSYGEKENHVFWSPTGAGVTELDEDGVPCLSVFLEQEQYIVSDTPGELPDITDYLSTVCYNAAWSDPTQFSVKSDHISVADVTILTDSLGTEGKGAVPDQSEIERLGDKIEETAYGQTYKSGCPLLATARNDRYETKATIQYVGENSVVGATRNKYVHGNVVNEINIHTPVICNPRIEAAHEEMYQCEAVPEGNTVLVLDEEGIHSDFILQVSNTGYHSDKRGYGENSYTKYLAQKDGKEQNEVCFPFAVWLDVGNDRETANDRYLDVGEWYPLGCERQRFYLPVETREGSHEIRFRSVAVNGKGNEDKSEDYRNEQPAHYAAEGRINVFITGRLYDFAVVEVGGTEAWEAAKKEGIVYTVGLQEPSWNLWETLPLRTGVHPYYRNIGGFPRGGFIKFRLKSIGSSFGTGTLLTITPQIVLVEDGAYHAVDVYYEEESEHGVFLKKWNGEEQRLVLKTEEETEKAIREWQGVFSLPEYLYAAEYGTDVPGYQRRFGLAFTEEFWRNDAKLLLRFAIQIVNMSGDTLYYGMLPDGIVNNIWKYEAGESCRKDNKGNRYEILGGETAVIYPGDSTKKEYTTYGIY
ncbi:MAG: hypothetical protein PUC73_07215, partial [Lachnospiraceae bacterium]|nr:hypothetical protein [Lachnospiraceae bacterium]